jgi:hypothetical protein
MVDVGQHQRLDATNAGDDATKDRRWRLRYNVALAAFLIGPAIAALAIMGWLKAP